MDERFGTSPLVVQLERAGRRSAGDELCTGGTYPARRVSNTIMSILNLTDFRVQNGQRGREFSHF